MKYVYFLVILLSQSFNSFSQEEDEACLPPEKKVLKLLEVAKKSSDTKSAIANFSEAITLAPENAMVYYEYAMFAYTMGLKNYDEQPNPAMGDRNFVKAEEMFQTALEHCSDYHANCSY
ncbi:MAG: hypothetical protein RL679_640, partial [Bacteroidota bacterium]